MYIIVVQFVIEEQYREDFQNAVLQQSMNSLDREEDCHQFDVCVSTTNRNTFLLYECYGNQAAFDLHLKTNHFKAFDQLTKSWIVSKSVTCWEPVNRPKQP